MDPNSNLTEQRRLVALVNRINDRADEVTGLTSDADVRVLADTAYRLAELVEALDGWMSGGGFLPRVWSVGR